mmetsp:Transcript_8820/g.21538  ORF Transcript_8820/g.21538 Transcript_8820/m.21538 type:complete len:1072 (+) Transcript_8820:160-3375(+)|eukprot:CAMPEP_0197189146 /NCGR_PEP_ID=MMETSP1423-20130617/19230_1 /TAXON_ID=476441 /ORGANISM="Pseudo-nitzschia heimii, Strain UNC1101" /LENGTH=1071 /DNA_ID=CAMNT_0042641185 /DNA_START=92 /DNA_END=3307 /DNA_ORIENTATION=+
MRFDAAFSALLAAEFVTAGGTSSYSRSSVEEIARFRKQAADSIVSLDKNERKKNRPFEAIHKNRNGRRLRDHSALLFNRHVEKLSRKLTETATHQEQRKQNGDRKSYSKILDVGILASPTKKKESNQKHRNGRFSRDYSTGVFKHQTKELSNKLLHVANNQDQRKENNSESVVPDLGILVSPPAKEESNPLEGRKQKVYSGTIQRLQLKNEKDSSDHPSSNARGATPDLGILRSVPMEENRSIIKKKLQTRVDDANHIRQKSDTSNVPTNVRRLQYSTVYPQDDLPEMDATDALTRPLGMSGELLCSVSSYFCEVCEVGDEGEMYSLTVSCSNFPEDYKYSMIEAFEGLQNMCSYYGICKSCDTDFENLALDMQECYEGGKKILQVGNGPIETYFGAICLDEEKASNCETCEFAHIYDEAGSKTTYNMKMECPNYPEDSLPISPEIQSQVQKYCEESNLCNTCVMDTENLSFDFQECDVGILYGIILDYINQYDNDSNDGNDGYLSDGSTGDANGIIIDDSNIFDNITESNQVDQNVTNVGNNTEEDAQEDVMESIMGYGPLASFATIFCDNEAANTFCNTCDLTYLDDEVGNRTYNLKMDCPDLPEESKSEANANLLSDCTAFKLCTTCNGNATNFYFDFQDCNSNSLYESFNPATVAVQSISYAFDAYFAGICMDSTCASCGSSTPDDYSSFSFSIDCPSRLSASDSGFGTYLSLAQAFCSSPEAQGVQCSTCDVDPWAATINIDDCVPITDYSQPRENATQITPTDEDAFVFTYQRFCNPTAYYLQDAVGTPNCDCRFDSTNQSASFSCLYEEVCREIDSYCPDNPLVLCETYRIEGTNSRSGPVNLNRCLNFTSPYDFSYCLSYGMNEVSGAADATLDPRFCEMEIDGVQCNECNLVQNKWGTEGFSAAMSVNVLYNCSNTLIGTNGPGNLSQYNLVDDTVSYFIYKSLPCYGGCDLCGVGSTSPGDLDPKTNFMTNPDGKFSSEFWKGGVEQRCFDAQLGALTLEQRVLEDECAAMRESAREPCGCENPNPEPESKANAFRSKPTSVAGVAVLTLAAASFAQILFG